MARKRHRLSRGQLAFWSSEPPASQRTPEQFCAAWRGKKIHLIGIGGIGMSGIARLLHAGGCVVSGCDAAAGDHLERLAALGIRVEVGHSPQHVADADCVVISAAIRDTNPELRSARRRGTPVLKYAQVLGSLMIGRRGVAVGGSHGKTTTSSMIAYSLSYAGRQPSMVVGGLVPQLGGNSCTGAGGIFVVEACEYDRSFLNLHPEVAVITNVDRDHLDYYRDIGELVEAFSQFAARVPEHGLVVFNGDDPRACEAARKSGARNLASFGLGQDCDWRIGEWNRSDGRTRFRAFHRGKNIGVFELLVPGLYNVYNALACVAVCSFFDVNRQDVREALADFRGARRRFDRLGEAAGILVLDDYGHHPTEVRVTLDAARAEFPSRRLWCVFQPHQHSRTRLLLDEFAQSFRAADRVIVPDIYAARDSEADKALVHSRDLVERLRTNGVEAEYCGPFKHAVDRLLCDVRRGDLVMTMGAGPVDVVGRSLLAELRKRDGPGK